MDLFDRFLIRGDNSRTSPAEAIYADAIDFEVVFGDALAIARDCDLILGLEDRVAGRSWSGSVGKRLCGAATTSRVVGKSARSEAKQLVWIASDLGQAQ